MKVTSIESPESKYYGYEINNWLQSPSNINDDNEKYEFTFELKIFDDKLKEIFSYYEDKNLSLSILRLQFEASGAVAGYDSAAINVLLEGENCSAEKKNSEYEYNIFEITRSVSNDYLSSINIDITYGGDQKIN